MDMYKRFITAHGWPYDTPVSVTIDINTYHRVQEDPKAKWTKLCAEGLEGWELWATELSVLWSGSEST